MAIDKNAPSGPSMEGELNNMSTTEAGLSGDGQVNATETTDKQKMQKGLIFGGIGLAAVVLIVLGFIFIPKMLGTDYKKSYEVASDLNEQLKGIYDDRSSACYKMASQISSESTDETKFNGYADDCQKLMVKAHDKIKELGETSGVKNDKDIKDKYNAFAEKAKVSLPEESELMKATTFVKDVHSFMLAASEISVDSSVEDVKKAADPIVNSDNKAWSKFASTWRDFMTDMIQIYQEYNSGKISQSELYNRYTKANKAYEEWAKDANDVAEEVPAEFDSDVAQEMIDEFNELYQAISDKQ